MRLARPAMCCLLFLVGCVAHAADVPAAANDPNKGWVMFSMTATGRYRSMAMPDLYYRGRNGVTGSIEAPRHKLRKDTGHLPYVQNYSSAVLDREDPLGAIKLLNLSPGDYEFYRYYRSGRDSGGNSWTIESQRAFSIPFSIKAGQVTYVGNVNFVFEDVGYAPQSSRGLRIEVNDEVWRDIKLFRERFTDFEKVPVQSSLPAPAE